MSIEPPRKLVLTWRKEFHPEMHAEGYSRMFQRMLKRCGGNVKVLLKTDYREVRAAITCSHLIYTGPIDEYFDYAPAKTPPQERWQIYGIDLPESILRKVYNGNAARELHITA